MKNALVNKFLKKGGNSAGNSGLTKGNIPKGALGFVGWGGVDAAMNMHAGDDVGTALVKGAATGMLWTAAPGPMWAVTGATLGRDAYVGYQNWKKGKQEWWQKQHAPNFGGNYQDSRRAMTMRQAAVQQIQGSKLNARSALGGEARILSEGRFRG